MTITKETKKALKIEKDGIYFWIQRRWLRADGSLTPAGENAYKNACEKKEFDNNLQPLPAPIAWESEKAVGLDMFFLLARCDGEVDKEVRQRIFLPKSQIADDKVKGWRLKAKVREAVETVELDEYYNLIVPIIFNFFSNYRK